MGEAVLYKAKLPFEDDRDFINRLWQEGHYEDDIIHFDEDLFEIFGGGIAPAIGGSIAKNLGIENILWMPLVGVALGAVVALFLKETAPVKVGHLAPATVETT